MKTDKKRIAVETNDGVKYYSVPVDELNDSQRTNANQVGTGVYVTDTYYSPRGLVIERRYSCWDAGNNQGCVGTYFRLVEDEQELIREHDGYGLKIEPVEA